MMDTSSGIMTTCFVKNFGGYIMKKRILAAMLASAMVLSMAACGSAEEPKEEKENKPAESTPAEPAKPAETPATEEETKTEE